jgi:hypothetical protein
MPIKKANARSRAHAITSNVSCAAMMKASHALLLYSIDFPRIVGGVSVFRADREAIPRWGRATLPPMARARDPSLGRLTPNKRDHVFFARHRAGAFREREARPRRAYAIASHVSHAATMLAQLAFSPIAGVIRRQVSSLIRDRVIARSWRTRVDA